MRSLCTLLFALSLAGCAVDAAPTDEAPPDLGGKADGFEIATFRFDRPLRTVPIEVGQTIEGTFDKAVHIGALFTTTSEQRFDVRLTFTNDPNDGVSPYVNLMLYRLKDDVTSNDENERWTGIAESSFGHERDSVDLSDTGAQPPGTYLLVLLASPYSETEHVGYSLELLTERDLPCTRGGRIVERGSISARGTATENGQGWAYYNARDAVEEDLEAQLDPIRTRCGEDIRVTDDGLEAVVLSTWSQGRWVASIGVPALTFSHDYEWSDVTDEQPIDACTEVERESEYARRFECSEEASLDWACCVL